MDPGRYVQALVSLLIMVITANAMFGMVWSQMDVKGDPTNWNQWNGYKAGAAFTLVNDAQSSSKNASDYVEREKKIVSTSSLDTPDRYICSASLPGFSEGSEINIVTDTGGKNCINDFRGINVSTYSKNNFSSMEMDTKPKRYDNYLKEGVN